MILGDADRGGASVGGDVGGLGVVIAVLCRRVRVRGMKLQDEGLECEQTRLYITPSVCLKVRESDSWRIL